MMVRGAAGVVRVVVRLPRVDEHGAVAGQRGEAAADHELRVGALGLDQHVAVRMRVAHQRRVHVQQGDPAERAMGDP